MTKLLYTDNTYLYEHQSKLVHIDSDDKGQYCLLEETIFYPQGGGQPCDTGTITVEGQAVDITFVAYVDGEVRHYGDFSAVKDTGVPAQLSIDENRRLTNAKAHTSGHLVQVVVEELDPSLKAVKGYHFPDGSYVEFAGESSVPTEERVAQANQRLAELIQSEVENTAKLVTREQLATLFPDLPYDVPSDKPIRIAAIGAYAPVPCGGTHLKSLGELTSVQIRKIKKKKGITKVSYDFS